MLQQALSNIIKFFFVIFQRYIFLIAIIFIFYILPKLNKIIPKRFKPNSTLVVLLNNEHMYQSPSYIKLLTVLDDVATNKNISEIFLDLNGIVTLENNYSSSFAMIDELRDSLNNCKAKGKIITAWSENYDLRSYYLALSANNITSTQYGTMMLGGLSQSTKFYKLLLDNLNIKYNLFRPKDNCYKSAGEIYIQNKFSEMSKEPIKNYAEDIDEKIMKTLNLEIAERNDSIDIKKHPMLSAKKAKEKYNLIDELKYKCDIYEDKKLTNFLSILQTEKQPSLKKLNTVTVDNYYNSLKINPNIAMIFINGQLGGINLFQNQDQVEKLTMEVNYILKQKKIKKVIICMDCPGGAVTVGDDMFNQLLKLRQSKKEIIVIQGTVAASGGYWLSCIGDKIYAHPLTVTGSIGVFSVIPNFIPLLSKMGISYDYINKENNFYSRLDTKDTIF